MKAKPDRKAWLEGGQASCNAPPEWRPFPWRLVLLGPPGVGKGTQAQLLSARLTACHLSTGDVFRAAKTACECQSGAAMGRALEYMRAGQLVPDEVVMALLFERAPCLRCAGGFLLDGFPRTEAQAVQLDELLKREGVRLNAAILYDLPVPTIVARLSGRRTCSSCHAVYHVESRPPQKAGVCDACGASLFQREDDRPAAIQVRMQAYETSTAPVVDFYRRNGLLVSIPSGSTPEETFERTLEAIRLSVLNGPQRISS